MARSDELGTAREEKMSCGTVRYRDRGRGVRILFVRGRLVTVGLWRTVVPRLAVEYRCVTPDLPLGSHQDPLMPGTDLSPPGLAAIIAELIAALDLDGVTLVANDT